MDQTGRQEEEISRWIREIIKRQNNPDLVMGQ
jgi:hypothetical protein